MCSDMTCIADPPNKTCMANKFRATKERKAPVEREPVNYTSADAFSELLAASVKFDSGAMVVVDTFPTSLGSGATVVELVKFASGATVVNADKFAVAEDDSGTSVVAD